MLTQKLLYLYALLAQFWRISLIEHSVKLPITHRLAATLRACKQLCTDGVRGASGAAAKNCGRMVS